MAAADRGQESGCRAAKAKREKEICRTKIAAYREGGTIAMAQTTYGTHAAEAQAAGRQSGECGFRGSGCAYKELHAIPCDRCGCSFHDQCAQASHGCKKSGWTSGCPTCHLRSQHGGNAGSRPTIMSEPSPSSRTRPDEPDTGGVHDKRLKPYHLLPPDHGTESTQIFRVTLDNDVFTKLQQATAEEEVSFKKDKGQAGQLFLRLGTEQYELEMVPNMADEDCLRITPADGVAQCLGTVSGRLDQKGTLLTKLSAIPKSTMQEYIITSDKYVGLQLSSTCDGQLYWGQVMASRRHISPPSTVWLVLYHDGNTEDMNEQQLIRCREQPSQIEHKDTVIARALATKVAEFHHKHNKATSKPQRLNPSQTSK